MFLKSKVKVVFGLLAMSAMGTAQAMSLQEAAQMAQDTNPEVLATKLESESRLYEIDGAKAGYKPKVDMLLGVGRENTHTLDHRDVDLTRKEAALKAEQMLFDGAATREEVNRQKARQSSSVWNSEATADDIVVRTAESYFHILQENELYLVAQESERNHASVYDQMQLREDSGVGSQADLDQITGRLALARTNVVTVQSNVVDASTAFQSLVGVYPDVGNMQYPDYKLKLPGSLDEAVAAAAATNPALLSAKADVDAATAQFEASKSPFWPRITLEAEHNFSDNAEGISGDEYSTLVALRMHYNLYRGGADKARKLQTAVLLNEALEIHADKQRKITQEMGYVWNAVQAVQRQMPYLEQHVESAAATRKAYYEQFNIGRRTLLDLLNTENELVDARRSLIKARFDLALSEMQLLALCGNLRPALGLKAAVEKAKP